MIYKITKIDRKTTSNGKLKADVSVVDVNNIETQATIWADFPNFANLDVNHSIEGDIFTKVNGKYTNHTLYPPKSQNTPITQNKGSGVVKAMEKKAENIKEAQENKQESIKISSSFRDATLLTVEWMKKDGAPFVTIEDVQKQWLEWRSWLYKHFDGEPF